MSSCRLKIENRNEEEKLKQATQFLNDDLHCPQIDVAQ